MAVTAKLYGLALKSFVTKLVDLSADNIKVMLVASSYTPDQDTHQFKSAVTGELATANGYTAGGVTLTNPTLTYDATSNTLKFDADDAVVTATAGNTLTARYAVIYDATPSTDATRPLLAFIDFGTDVSATGGAFTIQFNAAGIFTLTAA